MTETTADDRLLLDRDAELTAIGEAIAAAGAGVGSVLAIEGPAGVGKSSLLEEACARAAEKEIRVLRARGSESEREFGFGCVVQWLERLLDAAGAGEREALLEGSAGLAAPVLGLGGARPGGEASFAALHGLYWLCANLSERGPLLLALDDAHWADAASLRFVGYLAPRLEGLALTLTLAWRDDEPGAEADSLKRVKVDAGALALRPAPLSSAASAELVRARLGADSSDQLCATCHGASAGNPLLLTELVRTLSEQRPAGAHDPSAIAGTRLAAASRLVEARLERLGEDARRLAQSVAVLGDGALTRNAAALAGLEVEAARASADALRAAGVLEPSGDLAFTHPLVRAAVGETMGTGERAERHLRAARLLEAEDAPPERVAQHLLAGDPAGDGWSVGVLRRAARNAGGRGAPDAAVQFLRRALEEPPEAGQRPSVLMELGLAEMAAQDPAAMGHLEMALEGAEDPEMKARCALMLAPLGMLEAGAARGVHFADRGLAALPDRHRDSNLALALEAAAIGVMLHGLQPVESFTERLQRVERWTGSAESAVERWLLALVDCKRMVAGEITAGEAVASAETALENDLLLAEFGLEPPAHTWMVNMLVMAGRPERALDHYAQGLAKARRSGSAFGVASYLSLRCMAHLGRGDLLAAEADVEIARDSPGAGPLPTGLGVLATSQLEQGHLAAAQATIDSIPLPEDSAVADGQLCVVQAARGRIRIAAGELETGVTDLLAVGQRYESAGYVNGMSLPTGSWRPDAVRGLLALGRSEEARETADRELETSRAFDSPAGLGLALRAAASLEDGAGAVELLREARESLELSNNRLALARALVDLGAALRRLGHGRDARKPLREGLDLAHRCGARPLVDRALEELRSAGARPRRPRISGREALTPQERRIAEMASDGMTNREIAQALFLTLRTVEMHLSNAYGKLGISSRKGLAEALGGDGS